MRRPVILSLSVALVLTALVSAPTLAAGPEPDIGTGGEPADSYEVLPLTREQRVSQQVKEQLIEQVAADTANDGYGTEACPTPTEDPSTTAAGDGSVSPAPVDGTASSCYTPRRWVLTLHPRLQQNDYFCGPAVVQVLSNYAWAMASSANKYTQNQINVWVKAQPGVGAYLANFIAGLNNATAGSPRRPSNFVYMQKHNPTFTNWHNTIISGIYHWRMPLAAGVRPWHTNGKIRLFNWTKRSTGGHYIGIGGYDGYASSPNGSRLVLYTDTAGAARAGMGPGNYWDISRDVYDLMINNNKNMVY